MNKIVNDGKRMKRKKTATHIVKNITETHTQKELLLTKETNEEEYFEIHIYVGCDK